jgi:DNA-binding GntR family transcriptional regulator
MSETGLIPVERDETLAAKAYAQLRLALMRGRLVPGQRLVHRALAVEMGVSPTPVREALLRLVSEGALLLDARSIASVPHLDADAYAEILDLRVELEGRVAEAAATHATPAAIATLAAIHARLVAAKRANDIDTLLSENEDFHFQMIAASGLKVAGRLLQTLWVQCGPTIRLRYSAPHAQSAGGHPHVRLLKAMRARDPAGARAAVERDLLENGEVILRLLPRRGD